MKPRTVAQREQLKDRRDYRQSLIWKLSHVSSASPRKHQIEQSLKNCEEQIGLLSR